MYEVPKLATYTADELDKATAELTSALEAEAAGVRSEADWKLFRDRWMARKNGILTQINDTWLKAAPGPQKREVGQRVNAIKAFVQQRVGYAEIRSLVPKLSPSEKVLVGLELDELAATQRKQRLDAE